MYSCVSVLQKSAASCALVESHDTSTMRLVPEERTLHAAGGGAQRLPPELFGVGRVDLQRLPPHAEPVGRLKVRRTRLRFSFSLHAVEQRSALQNLDLRLDVGVLVAAAGSETGLTFFMFRNSSLSP